MGLVAVRLDWTESDTAGSGSADCPQAAEIPQAIARIRLQIRVILLVGRIETFTMQGVRSKHLILGCVLCDSGREIRIAEGPIRLIPGIQGHVPWCRGWGEGSVPQVW